ncbi:MULTISPECIES: AmmeMemoRadiSam system protein B [unclassified Mesorhizobium]|uniref:AmmeMemoRadiSam system protein B n=2 Tax=Mesorhizobium TaxID=68287 RepID=UPI0010931311|nr:MULTISPECIES: AmmeMemoRadiSam system protein B [unclassified Mesorhizobium]TGP91456.1 AmmeMemoRadiSam system protein B [Mesorhizobium sp. M8A.F.Ca.ET.218.01.1.1]TGS44735.1 AmmeMemoRadiSam system protein B [Mesorhizobium sp. M8A.F.Ca.ET.182.01.1.1]TGS80434.1 AmmeMemoRadiSam system protein B [Mesorhizobium sp. M8A.F.Ca.ET.181.01.1.1]TGT17186.1 AmmeMemoRadiSam system protein B [Mesorhizobium sp. M8A.F.Ca.ET.213.01.1.1]
MSGRTEGGRLGADILQILAALLFTLLPLPAFTAPVICPSGSSNFPPFYDDAKLFENAIASAAEVQPSNQRLTGITVPHHLLAADLVALGFHAASGFRYKRIVILSPDHFHKTHKLYATTARGFDTVLGPVKADTDAVRLLEKNSDMVEESCLFDKEHGVRAMLPFLHHYFPEAKIVPVAMSVKARRRDWDRLAEALKTIVDHDTLIVESTDFSHYLPQHEAHRFDQQSLNMLAASSLDGIAALRQPDHADSVGALYIQTRLQRELFGALPLVVANENSQEHTSDYVERTTSYVVALFGAFGPDFNNPTRPKDKIYYLAGDVNFGRAMKKILVRDGVADRIVDSILSLTNSRPLIVNLEGVILPNVPEAIDDMTLAMPEGLAVDMLKRLHVAGVSLANNHAYDLGPSGYAETLQALDEAGIPHVAQGETLALADLDLVGLTDIDTNGSKNTDLLTPALLDRLLHENAERPVVAFVHWGREYKTEPSAREEMLADQMRLRGVSAIVGGHPHVSSEAIVPLGGGDVAEVYSLGNFLFDQKAERSSGSMLELRVFPQGTIFARLIPLPNYFEMGRK